MGDTRERLGFAELPTDFHGLHGWFRQMRADDPVSRDEKFGAWDVFRYADIEYILGNPAIFSSDFSDMIPPQPEFDLFAEGSFVGMDPPRHSKLRRLVSKAFTPRVVAGLEPRIATITGELLDAAARKPAFDAVADLAYPLPVIVIAELIGVPVADRELFRRWADELFSQDLPDTVLPDEAELQQRGARLREMLDYLLAHIASRRAQPAGDLTTTLIAAEVDGERLTDREMVGFVALLLIAGHITTTTLLTNTIMCLDENPSAALALRADPARIPAALEEVLRYRTPFPRLARLTKQDTQIAGQAVPRGQVLNVWVASANRDEQHFAEPDRFDIGRNPNPHVAFGHGIHFCIGAPLARLEGRIAVDLLLRRSTELSVEGETDLYDPRVMTGARSLPVRAAWTDAG
ncbi:cytochrome P450 [Allorhizocola rhizosphaerae]|uniref:cytochrome P450 n=1 Tax=Allorhizocola rhizosphaerae TaxID=1872709 RepID=UPI001B8B21FE|nr:cytochrome P450 [Allorhizocola rhizosphaerae]